MRHLRPLLFIIVASLIVQSAALAWAVFRAGRIDGHAFRSLDCGEYYALAKNIARHGRFSQSNAPPLAADTWRTPGYPLFLAAAVWLIGDSPTALILIQHLLGVATVLLLFQIVRRHMPPARAGIATAIVLLEPYHVFYAFWLLSTTFFSFLLVLAWWSWERAKEQPAVWNYVLLGLLCGFLVLIWPGAVLIPLFVAAGFLIDGRSSITTSPHHQITTSPLRRWRMLLVFLLASSVLVVSWMARNKAVAGHFALSHQSGIVLAYFKATEVELWRQGRTEDRYIETSLNPANRDRPHRVWSDIDAQLQHSVISKCSEHEVRVPDPCRASELTWPNLAQGNKTSHDSFAVSRMLATIGVSMLIDFPFSTGMCWLTRIGENLVFPLGLSIHPAKEAPVDRLKAAAIGGVYALLAFAAVVGLFRARRNLHAVYFPTCCLLALALTTAPQIDPRFRVPMIPLLAFLALLQVGRAESE